MPRLIISNHGSDDIHEVQLTRDITRVGRRPYNDLVLEHITVSGEHALLQRSGTDVYLEDLGSTNGSCINGQRIRRQRLQHGDLIGLGACVIRFEHPDGWAQPQQKPDPLSPHAVSPGAVSVARQQEPRQALIQVLSGAATGQSLALVKALTTVGKPGVAVATISRNGNTYALTHVDGAPPSVNGVAVGLGTTPLCHGDRIELAGVQMQFMQP